MPLFVSLVDRAVVARNRQRGGPVGHLVAMVMDAYDPDGAICRIATAYLTGCSYQTRQCYINTLAEAFGANRAELKRYLRSKSVCGPRD